MLIGGILLDLVLRRRSECTCRSSAPPVGTKWKSLAPHTHCQERAWAGIRIIVVLDDKFEGRRAFFLHLEFVFDLTILLLQCRNPLVLGQLYELDNGILVSRAYL